MKNKMFGLVLAGAMLAATPFAAMAADRGGERGHSGGGNSYSEGARGGEHFNGGHDSDRRDRGGDRDRDRDNHDGGLYRGGVYFSAGAAPVYGYTAPNPCGYYDAAGYWHADPACYGPPAAY